MIFLDNKTFAAERGELVMHVVPRSGRRREPYRHACPRAALEAVAHSIDEAGAEGIDRRQIHAASGARHTQVSVAMAFLVERGAVEETGPRGSVLRPSGTCSVHLEAMTEYFALAEGEAGGSLEAPA